MCRHVQEDQLSLSSNRSRSTSAAAGRDTGPAGGLGPSGADARGRVGFSLVAGVYALAMLPIPLYVLWALQFGFGAFIPRLVFAANVLGTVLTLVVFGSSADRAGRRPLLGAVLVVMAASTVLFLLARDVGGLLAARLISGLATGRRHRDRDRCNRSWLLRLIREESDVCHHEGPACPVRARFSRRHAWLAGRLH